jgi:hypothetical protein
MRAVPGERHVLVWLEVGRRDAGSRTPCESRTCSPRTNSRLTDPKEAGWTLVDRAEVEVLAIPTGPRYLKNDGKGQRSVYEHGDLGR